MKKENLESVKALKKQLGAAVAMVCVAAVALGSSTYAWFVTNNTVKATTSTISAQSNAAFMKIKYDTTATTSDLTADVATLDSDELYPAQWANSFTTVKGTDKATSNNGVYQFETAYGTNPTSTGYKMNADTLKAIGAPTDAVTAEYAVANKFNISSKGTDLTNLKVSGATILSDRAKDNTTVDDHGNDKLDNALRVLVVCKDGDNTYWVLCDKDGVISDSQGRTKNDADTKDLGKFGTGVTVTHDVDTEVNLYVYYDGNDTQIYSNNLPNLQAASSRITVTFTADADNK